MLQRCQSIILSLGKKIKNKKQAERNYMGKISKEDGFIEAKVPLSFETVVDAFLH